MFEAVSPLSAEDEQRRSDLKKTSRMLMAAFLTGCVFVWLRFAIYWINSWKSPNTWTVTGQTFTSLLWCGAWFAVAFVFGFLFGIPKALQASREGKKNGDNSDANASSENGAKGDAGHLKVNTNLEEISDWLTKILVGATLTQLVKIPGAIKAAADFMADGPAGTGSVPFAAAIIIYFSAIGFFAGYVLTRMFFSLAFGLFDKVVQFQKGLPTSELERAVAAPQLTKTAIDPEAKENTYNSLVYRLLYQPPPEGFTKAIQYAKEFLSDNTPRKSSIFVNLACAYGQQYRFLKDHGGSEAALSIAKDQALDAIKKALNLSPESKSRFQELLHASADPQDDDLQVFEKEKEFTDLLD